MRWHRSSQVRRVKAWSTASNKVCCQFTRFGAPPLAPRFLTSWNDSDLKDQTNVPVTDPAIQSLLGSIAQENRHNYSGCWDVIAWNGPHLLFAEAKLKGRDEVRATQLRVWNRS
jgi:hypothetical protein